MPDEDGNGGGGDGDGGGGEGGSVGMQRREKWTQEEVDLLLSMKKKGRSVRDIALALAKSPYEHLLPPVPPVYLLHTFCTPPAG